MMAHQRKKAQPISVVWKEMKPRLDEIFTALHGDQEGITRRRWMELYTLAYDFCTNCTRERGTGGRAPCPAIFF